MNLPIDIEALEACTPSAFSEVSFALEGTVPPKITSLLESGGAKKRFTVAMNASYLIAGADADEVKLEETKDVFEVPVVVPEWAALSLKLGKVVSVDGFEKHYKKLFSSVTVCTSGIHGKDLKTIWALITYYGGEFRKNLTSKCTHLITNRCGGNLFKVAKEKGIKIVCSDWIIDSIKNDAKVEENPYDPAFLITSPPPAIPIPQPVPPVSASQLAPAGAAKRANETPLTNNTTKSPAPPKPATPTIPAPGVRPTATSAPTTVPQILQNQLLTQPSVGQRPPVPLSLSAPGVQGGRLRLPLQNQQQPPNQLQKPQNLQQPQPNQQPSPNLQQQQPNQQQQPSPNLQQQQPNQQQQPSPNLQQQQPNLQQPPNLQQQFVHQQQGNQQGQLPSHLKPVGQQIPGQQQQFNHMQPQTQATMMSNQPNQNQMRFPMQQQMLQQQQQQPPQGQLQTHMKLPQQGPGQQQSVVQQQFAPSQPRMMVTQQNQGRFPMQPMMQQQQQSPGMQQQQQIPPHMHPGSQQLPVSPGSQQYNQMQPPHMMTPGQSNQIRFQMPQQQQFQQQQGVQQIQQHMKPISQQVPLSPSQSQPQQFSQIQSPQYPPQQNQARFPIQVPLQQQQQQPMHQHNQQQFQQQQGISQGQMQPHMKPMPQQGPGQPGQAQPQQQFNQMQPGMQSPHSMMGNPPNQVRYQIQSPIQQQMHQQQGIPQGQVHMKPVSQPMGGPGGQPRFGQGQPPHMMVPQQNQNRFSAQPLTPQQQQQMEIVQHLQQNPQIQQQWGQWDSGQRQLYIQKFYQQRREGQLRDMLLRQQHMQQPGGPGSAGQPLQNQQQMPASSPTQIGQQQISMGPGQLEKSMGQQMHQGHPSLVPGSILSPTNPSGQQSPVPLSPQQQQQGQQQQIILQGHPDLQKGHPGQAGLPNHHPLQQKMGVQQKITNPQMSPTNQQKFLAPAPVQIRPPHGVIGSPQNPQAAGVVRTQQIFTPQIGQQPGSAVRIHNVVIQPGPNRPVMHQMQGQKIHILPSQQPGQPGGQWHASQQQRPITPGPQSPFPRVSAGTPPEPPGSGPPQQWNVRPPSQSPQSPGGQPNVSYVQMVNSKTKTALANLLSNRLQGSASPESSSSTPVSSAATSPTSTTQAICPPPPPPVTSQSLPHSAPTTTQCNILLSQRRTLDNITNGCKTIQVNSFGAGRVATPQASPNVPVAPPRPQYFGHDPQIKPPPGAFFLGCYFWAPAEFEWIRPNSNLKEAVLHYGGTIVDEYTVGTVTHVVAESAKFPEFPQVLREGKRLVSPLWVTDVIERQVMVPPYQAFHFPSLYPKGTSPLRGHVISSVNFRPNDKQRLRSLVKLLGAKYTNYFSKLNTCLVCNKPEGAKYQKAREWKVPVVSTQFISEIFLGQMSALNMIHSPKYQSFNPDQSFRLDYTLVPNLMAAWKIPIRVTPEAMESFKVSKRASEDSEENGPAAKRIKLGPLVTVNGNKEIIPPDTEPLSPGEEPDMDKAKLEVLENKEIAEQTTETPTEESKPKPVENGPCEKEAGDADTKIQLGEEAMDQSSDDKSKIQPVTEICEKPLESDDSASQPLKGQENSDSRNSLENSNSLDANVEPKSLDKIQSLEENLPNGGIIMPMIFKKPPVVIISGFTQVYKEKMKDKIEKLGGSVTRDWLLATHLVMKENFLTTKLFYGLCRYQYIVTSRWILESVRAGKFVDEKDHILRHEWFETTFGTTVAEVLSKPARHFLFKGVTFFITPGYFTRDCPKQDLERIIEAAGGSVERNVKSLRHIRDFCSKFPKRSVIITCEEDYALMEEFFMGARRPHVINIYGVTFVWQCIATQTMKLRHPNPNAVLSFHDEVVVTKT